MARPSALNAMRLRPFAIACVVLLSACSHSSTQRADPATEPIFSPWLGEVVLVSGRAGVGQGQPGVQVADRDGAFERVVALNDEVAAVAGQIQQRYGSRYHFTRTDLGGITPTTVELRGHTPAGALVIATVSRRPAAPLYDAVESVAAAPPDHPTSLVVTLIGSS